MKKFRRSLFTRTACLKLGVALATSALTTGSANAQTSVPDLWQRVPVSKFGQLSNLNISQRPAPADGVLLDHHREESRFKVEEMAINSAGDRLAYTDRERHLVSFVDITDPSKSKTRWRVHARE